MVIRDVTAKKNWQMHAGNDHAAVPSAECGACISVRDPDLLTIWLVLDMWTEKANDSVKYKRVATQKDFGKF